ncbi:unnamed protein product [Vitrella brassicaformis CCMP3155]|uniref:Reverse transcriptase Ty1/copia-type domain-containing protein n=1 Tax=Vitrella brassicaformis (strain CCMP3155) TaxID=1169540 RepID=A0A0G4EM36_VITBC|nr:unnamed protein product [Vitrella brassicaformis CCMP3155]|eukprot:CEL97913.1 unnamed protein product [Vitrella brassicaformis CCMP3155]
MNGTTGTPLDHQLHAFRAHEGDVRVADDEGHPVNHQEIEPRRPTVARGGPAEVDKLEQHKTYEWGERRDVPRGAQIFSILAVGTTKPDGRPKTQLVINGSQGEREHETLHAPTSRTATAKLLFGTALAKGYDIEQVDVESAFLHASMPEQQQPLLHRILHQHTDRQTDRHNCSHVSLHALVCCVPSLCLWVPKNFL